MLKHLPVFIICFLFFTTAKAQTTADSLEKKSTIDTVKSPLIDTLAKKTIDTIAKHPLIDSLVKHTQTDTVVKHTVVDSVINHLAADSVTKPKPAIKHIPFKGTVKHPAEVIVVKHSTVKTLSDTRYNAYLNGEDLDSLALPGEVNHYPLPAKALKYKAQLGLNPGQITQLKELAATLHRKQVEMGTNIIRNEKMIDSLFHNKQMTDGILIFYTNRSGLYYGELKGAILLACYNTEQILSDDQIKKLEALEKGN